MIHQPFGGVGGTSKDIEIQAREIIHLKKTIAEIIQKHSGQKIEKVIEDSERDYYLSPEEAIKYGLIDNILTRTPRPLAGALASW